MSSLSYRNTIRTVTEISREIKALFDSNFLFVRIIGEISNLHQPHSGHLYFNLKDDNSQIRAVLFKSSRKYLAGPLQNGQRIICDGKITVYQPRGEYQIVIDSVDFHGTGDLQIAFNSLKEKLRNEGLFDQERKLAIPSVPEKLIIITSPAGAAIHDFITVCKKSRSSLLIQILPTRVQGDGAAEEISACIRSACALKPDVIVLCRGGGSIEDLWCFNEETVARSIYNADIPIITGIGHETDYTISDFCSDMRCATPTAAAEFLTRKSKQYPQKINQLSHRLGRAVSWKLDSAQTRSANSEFLAVEIDSLLNRKSMELDALTSRLTDSMVLNLERLEGKVQRIFTVFSAMSPLQRLKLLELRFSGLSERLYRAIPRRLDVFQAKLGTLAALLDSLSPLSVLARGYAIASKADTEGRDSVITDASQVKISDRVKIRLKSGRIDCEVLKKYDQSGNREP